MLPGFLSVREDFRRLFFVFAISITMPVNKTHPAESGHARIKDVRRPANLAMTDRAETPRNLRPVEAPIWIGIFDSIAARTVAYKSFLSHED